MCSSSGTTSMTVLFHRKVLQHRGNTFSARSRRVMEVVTKQYRMDGHTAGARRTKLFCPPRTRFRKIKARMEMMCF